MIKIYVWATIDNSDAKRTLKQHCFTQAPRGGGYFEPYIGNKALCSRIGVHDGDKYVDAGDLFPEEAQSATACKKCLKIFKKINA